MSEAAFRVFGLDRQLYGPVSAETLRGWARDGRVQRRTWVHCEDGNQDPDNWRRAEAVPELAEEFSGGVAAAGSPEPGADSRPDATVAATDPTAASYPAATAGRGKAGPATSKLGAPVKVLTRLKLFADFTPEALEPFARAMVEESYSPFSYIVQQGGHGDAMYFVLQGRVGVSTHGQVTESFLANLTLGDTFGEMSLFDPGPRSADVRAENDVILLKLTAEALGWICAGQPSAANPFLRNVAKLLSARMRQMDRRAASAKDLDAAGRGVR